MIRADYHVHSSHSGDSSESILNHITEAIKHNLQYLCFTDHMDLDYPVTPPGHEDEACDFTLDIESYHREIIKYQNSNKSSILDQAIAADVSSVPEIMYGIELGLQPQVANDNKKIATSNKFDFIIGSIHVFDSQDPYYPEFWIDKKDSEIYRRYFESMYENICIFDDFDVLGHIDYLFRYGKEKDLSFKYVDYADELDSILRKIIESGKGIEINTGGLRSGLKFPNPNPEILNRYKELGGEIITVGSDAHIREHLAWNFDAAEAILKNCGFEYYTVFKDRKPTFLKL